jgi:predicted nucleic acid-binding protein
MAVSFLDTSALGKRYIVETGSVWLRALLDPATGCEIYIVRITTVEMISAITRRERGGSLTPGDAITARATFRSDLASEYQLVEVTETLVNQAMVLAETYGLRGYDAVQLAAALEVSGQYVAGGFAPITLISADAELNGAATTEGLIVEDPNAHP